MLRLLLGGAWAMLAFDLTPWKLVWGALIVYGVWMCVVILMFAVRHESKNWFQD